MHVHLTPAWLEARRQNTTPGLAKGLNSTSATRSTLAVVLVLGVGCEHSISFCHLLPVCSLWCVAVVLLSCDSRGSHMMLPAGHGVSDLLCQQQSSMTCNMPAS